MLVYVKCAAGSRGDGECLITSIQYAIKNMACLAFSAARDTTAHHQHSPAPGTRPVCSPGAVL